MLGSGLGGLADDVEDAVAIPFAELPGWPAATAPGHAGRLLLGRLGGRVGGHAPGPVPPVRGQPPGPGHPAGPAVQGAGRVGRRPDECGRRPGPELRAGHADGHVRPHQPDRAEPADRPERGCARRAVPGHDRGVEPAPSRRRCGPRATPRASSWRRGSMSGSPVRTTRPRPRSGCWRRWAVTRSGCPRSSNASPLAGSASRSAASRS